MYFSPPSIYCLGECGAPTLFLSVCVGASRLGFFSPRQPECNVVSRVSRISKASKKREERNRICFRNETIEISHGTKCYPVTPSLFLAGQLMRDSLLLYSNQKEAKRATTQKDKSSNRRRERERDDVTHFRTLNIEDSIGNEKERYGRSTCPPSTVFILRDLLPCDRDSILQLLSVKAMQFCLFHTWTKWSWSPVSEKRHCVPHGTSSTILTGSLLESPLGQ